MTPRQWRWLATLRRHGPRLLAACLLGSAAADAATLRPFRELSGNIVRLSDLFDQLGATPDRDLGRGPGPGDRIVVEAPQLAAIARDFGVAWRPISGAERAVLERDGVPLDETAVLAPLRARAGRGWRAPRGRHRHARLFAADDFREARPRPPTCCRPTRCNDRTFLRLALGRPAGRRSEPHPAVRRRSSTWRRRRC